MTTYAPKSEAIVALQCKNDRYSNRETTLFCPKIGFFDPKISEGYYGIPTGNGMLWGNPGDWLINKGDEFSFMSDEDFKEKYYRLVYYSPPGEVY